MSLYNMIRGVNPATFLLLPMLGKHPDAYPRFRDCFLGEDKQSLVVLTRTGGGNREAFEEENRAMQESPHYICDADAAFDSTYAEFRFRVPEEWREDLALILGGAPDKVSGAYRRRLRDMFPKLADRWDQDFPLRAGD